MALDGFNLHIDQYPSAGNLWQAHSAPSPVNRWLGKSAGSDWIELVWTWLDLVRLGWTLNAQFVAMDDFATVHKGRSPTERYWAKYHRTHMGLLATNLGINNHRPASSNQLQSNSDPRNYLCWPAAPTTRRRLPSRDPSTRTKDNNSRGRGGEAEKKDLGSR